jgi:tetratricopeptide (TPR) repeat protein
MIAAVVLGVVLALQNANPAVQQRDTRAWYQAYDDARKDIAAGRWQSAVSNLQLAVRLGPKPGRNVLTYGQMRLDFVPDYDLGIAYLNLKRYAEADAAFTSVARSGLIGPKDPEYAAFSQQARTATFEHELALAEQAFAARQFDLALKQVAGVKGRARGADVARVNALITSINEAIRANASTANPPVTNPQTSAPPSEDTAIAPFFSGDYAGAVSALTALVDRNAASPRVFFYLACSKVALVFTGQADEAALKDAQAALRSAGNPSQFASDMKFISPRILRRLGVRQ